MKGLELLEKYPLSATLIQAWFLEKMIESLDDASISDEFKRMMREAGIENDKIGTLIDVNPRMLIDVFLENNIQISINPLLESRNFEGSIYLNFEKIKSIENEVYKELEKEIITICFEELENIL
jgi:hypothetical protein